MTRRFVDPYCNTRGTTAAWTSGHTYLNAPMSSLSGIVQLGARAFDPATGKFLTVDSVLVPDNPQQNNGYSYTSNNPITRADPSGYCYSTPIDSLNFHTNCVGSTGSAAGNGAAYVAHGVPLAPGNSSSDYGIYHAVTTAPDAKSNGGSGGSGGASNSSPQLDDSQVLGCGPAGCITAGQFRPGSVQNYQDRAGLDLAATGALTVGDLGLAYCEESILAEECAGPADEVQTLDDQEAAQIGADLSAAGSVVAPSPYSRPSGATTPAQRASVQDLPCVDCGTTTPSQIADHITPLVKEWYETGTIDKTFMRSLDAVQPQCPTCSAAQGGRLSWHSRTMRDNLFGKPGP